MASTELADLYDAHAQALFAFLLNFTRNEADARDVLQEVFAKLTRQAGGLQAIREMRPFLLRLAHNLAVDSGRRRQTRDKYHLAAGLECEWPTTLRSLEQELGHAGAGSDDVVWRYPQP